MTDCPHFPEDTRLRGVRQLSKLTHLGDKAGIQARSVCARSLSSLHYPAQPGSQIKDANLNLLGNYILPALTDVH